MIGGDKSKLSRRAHWGPFYGVSQPGRVALHGLRGDGLVYATLPAWFLPPSPKSGDLVAVIINTAAAERITRWVKLLTRDAAGHNSRVSIQRP